MAGGQLLVLMPPQIFAEKAHHQARRKVPRCLFGPPDPVETEKLLQEQRKREIERFERRWNVDLVQLEAAFERKEKELESMGLARKKQLEESDMGGDDQLEFMGSGSKDHLGPVESSARVPKPGEMPVEVQEKASGGSRTVLTQVSRNAVQKKSRTSRFQKRVRAASGKRQTYLTDFWRSRKTFCRVYGKSKSRLPAIPVVQAAELLEAPAQD